MKSWIIFQDLETRYFSLRRQFKPHGTIIAVGFTHFRVQAHSLATSTSETVGS